MQLRIPWTPLALSVAVLISSGLAVQPVRDAATRADVAEAYLTRPMSYVAMAPLSNTLDALALMSVRQHIAVVLGVIVLFAAWRTVKETRARPGWRSHLSATITLFVGILAAYGATAMLPRPMAALIADNANILIADFHSHTSASHDVRSAWTAERNRAWHRDAGYHVAYVTDHAAVAGAEQGIANNPNPAAAGVTLLQGIEVTWNGEHVNILGAERTYKGLLTANMRDVDAQALALASIVGGREPIVVWNHPRDLSRLPTVSQPNEAGVRAIEIVNGSPADMDRVRARRSAIAVLAQQKNISLTSGSDNHGWGRATPAWTILRVFGWRSLQGDALGLRIEAAIRESGNSATRVVERVVADPEGDPLLLGLSIATVPARMLTTLSNEERVVWILWIWLIAAGAWWIRRRRQELST